MITQNEIGENNGLLGIWYDPEHKTISFCNWYNDTICTMSVSQFPKFMDMAQRAFDRLYAQDEPKIETEP